MAGACISFLSLGHNNTVVCSITQISAMDETNNANLLYWVALAFASSLMRTRISVRTVSHTWLKLLVGKFSIALGIDNITAYFCSSDFEHEEMSPERNILLRFA